MKTKGVYIEFLEQCLEQSKQYTNECYNYILKWLSFVHSSVTEI